MRGSNVLAATSHANQTAIHLASSTKAPFTEWPYIWHCVGCKLYFLSDRLQRDRAGLTVTGSPASLTMEPSAELLWRLRRYYWETAGGQTTFGATYEVGGIYITAFALSPNQINPPNMFISGAGATAGNTIVIADLYNPGTAAQGYCSGNNATNGWSEQRRVAETWNSVYVIPRSLQAVITVAGSCGHFSASPMMSRSTITSGGATGYVKLRIQRAAPGQISAVGDWDFSIHYLGDGQQSMMRLTGNVSDYITTKVCLGVSYLLPRRERLWNISPDFGVEDRLVLRHKQRCLAMQ